MVSIGGVILCKDQSTYQADVLDELVEALEADLAAHLPLSLLSCGVPFSDGGIPLGEALPVLCGEVLEDSLGVLLPDEGEAADIPDELSEDTYSVVGLFQLQRLDSLPDRLYQVEAASLVVGLI